MCSHRFTATEHCDPGWKISGGGLATKFPLWKLNFEDSGKKITLNQYKEIRAIKKQTNKKKMNWKLMKHYLLAASLAFSHFACEFLI